MFKHALIAAALALPLAALAADDKKMTPQQNKMAACNKDAGAKKLEGDARKAFMKDCLSADGKASGDGKAGGARTPQQEKMAACNKSAAEKKLAGEERKKFMSSCLSG
jgi:hypothetical protein